MQVALLALAYLVKQQIEWSTAYLSQKNITVGGFKLEL